MDYTTTCPGCGREITIPPDLDSCFCTYCGGKVERPAAPPPETSSFRPEAMAQRLLELMETAPRKASGRSEYEDGFQLCRLFLADPIAELEVSLDPVRRQEQIDQTAAACLDALAERWAASGKKPVPQYEDQHLMAVYLIPALRDLPQDCGEELARAVRDLWLARWPKTPIGLGDHDTIVEGFKKKLCFITTAVCRQRGLGDDCYELTMFRRFRDQVLLPTEEGRALVDAYYRTAPAIVTAMELCQDTEAVCGRIWRDYLAPCLNDIESGNNDACRERYAEMVRCLERTCLPC